MKENSIRWELLINMENRVLLDANAVLRFLLDDIHEQYLKASETIKSNHCFLVLPVVQEAAYILDEYYGVPRMLIKEKFIEIKKFIAIEDEDVYTKAFEYFAQTPKLDFTDCILCAYHSERKLDILTFDKKLKKKMETD